MSTEKIPPNDSDAEEAALGALLIDGDKYDEITLTPQDFYYELNQHIFQAMVSLRKRGIGINQITVSQELAATGKTEIAGGQSRLSYLISVCPSSLDLGWYADVVRRMSIYRMLLAIAGRIVQMAYEASGDLNVTLEKVDDMILSVRKIGGGITILSPEDITEMAIGRYNDLFNKEGVVPVTTGLIDLDKELGGGCYKGEMIIVAGRPGMGKTELCFNIAESASVSGNVLFCSAEMPVESIIDRYVAGKLGLPLSVIRQGHYTESMLQDILGEPLQKLRDANIYMTRETPMTTEKILQAGMSMKLRHGLAMIIVDYLGILDDEYGDNQYERVGYISRKIKQIARILDIPVIAIHQLHREVERREDKRPQLSDLRDSGKLEEDADVVLLLYRESYYNDKSINKETEIIIAKQRQGEANKIVGVNYDITYRKYRNLARNRD